MSRHVLYAVIAGLLSLALSSPVRAQSPRYDELANLPFTGRVLSTEGIATLKDELVFQRAVQSYLWALPTLNMYGMKEGSEQVFGKGAKYLLPPPDYEGETPAGYLPFGLCPPLYLGSVLNLSCRLYSGAHWA